MDNANEEHEGKEADAAPKPATAIAYLQMTRFEAVAHVLSTDSTAVVNRPSWLHINTISCFSAYILLNSKVCHHYWCEKSEWASVCIDVLLCQLPFILPLCNAGFLLMLLTFPLLFLLQWDLKIWRWIGHNSTYDEDKRKEEKTLLASDAPEVGLILGSRRDLWGHVASWVLFQVLLLWLRAPTLKPEPSKWLLGY